MKGLFYIVVSKVRGFPGSSDCTGSPCNMGDLGSISGLGRSPREGHGYAFQYSCLENRWIEDRMPWIEELGRLQSMGLRRVGLFMGSQRVGKIEKE